MQEFDIEYYYKRIPLAVIMLLVGAIFTSLQAIIVFGMALLVTVTGHYVIDVFNKYGVTFATLMVFGVSTTFNVMLVFSSVVYMAIHYAMV